MNRNLWRFGSIALVLIGAALVSGQGVPNASSKPAPRSESSTRVGVASDDKAEALHVAVFWNAATQSASVKVGARSVKSDAELRQLVVFAEADMQKLRHAEMPVLIDSAREVPWGELVGVIQLCRAGGAHDVTLAIPAAE